MGNIDWMELKIKEQENRLVALKQETAVLRLRVCHMEDISNTLMKAMRKIAEGK